MRKYNGCAPPMPMSLYKNSNFHPHVENLLVDQLFNNTHLNHIDEPRSTAIFKAYHKLARCAIPKEDLLWLDMSQQKDSAVFWDNLTSFLGMKLDPKVHSAIVEAGVPYYSGSKGCNVGKNKCKYVKHSVGQDAQEPAIIPSVCALA